MMASRRTWLLGITLFLPTLLSGCTRVAQSSNKLVPPPPPPPRAAAASGRIEGCDRTIDIGATIDGVVARLLVVEGQVVRAGQVLAEVDCRDVAAQLEEARARVEASRAALVRLLHGAREEERQVARAELEEARAALDKALDREARARQLNEHERIVPNGDRVQAELEARRASAAVAVADARLALTVAEPLAEDQMRLRAELAAAQALADSWSERLEKCSIRAPSGGTVLRTIARPGELVGPTSPTPVVQLADLSCWRVRAEVDERDAGRIQLGDSVSVTADGWDDQTLSGVVTELAPRMGRKTVRSLDPAEKADRDVREVVATLGTVDQLGVVGLRVTVLFAGGTGTGPNADLGPLAEKPPQP